MTKLNLFLLLLVEPSSASFPLSLQMGYILLFWLLEKLSVIFNLLKNYNYDILPFLTLYCLARQICDAVPKFGF